MSKLETRTADLKISNTDKIEEYKNLNITELYFRLGCALMHGPSEITITVKTESKYNGPG